MRSTNSVTMLNAAVSIVMMLCMLVASSDAFAPYKQQQHKQQRTLPFAIQRTVDPVPLRSSSKLFFFGRNKNKEPTEEAQTNSDIIIEAENIPTQKDDWSKKASADVPPPSPLTGTEEAARLRAEAARARLEAERLDAELTLRKIERLEKELSVVTADATAATAGSSPEKKRAKSSEDLQRELDALLTKVRGAKTQPISSLSTSSISAVAGTDKSATNPTSDTKSSSRATASASNKVEELLWPKYVKPFDEEQYKECYNAIKNLPQFLLATIALQVEMEIETDPETGKSLVNVTEVAVRTDKMRRFDFSYSSKGPPTFTPQQIAQMEADLTSDAKSEKKEGSWWGGVNSLFSVDEDEISLSEMALVFQNEERYRGLFANDKKALAKLMLEYTYYMTTSENDDVETVQKIMGMAAEEPWLKPMLGGITNITIRSGIDSMILGLYPKCITEIEAQEGDLMPPTEAQVRQLIADILPKVNFKSTSKPEAVLGGFIVRGSTSLGGDAFIAKLDAEMERSNLKDKMTVLYTQDFTVFADDFAPDLNDETPILYVVAPDICRTAKPVATSITLSVVSASGLATAWYLSVYPFLLNTAIAARVDEQLAIADANMVADLAWLTDLSIPLFATFMGIQLIHELGHLVVAGANGIKTSSPTFVPSVLTGITSSVTTFKSPPKNLAAMFDYAVAGPLAGMAASLLAIAVGSQLTTIADPSLFPVLPLEFLRQSTLGGGIIELVLGDGPLYVPQGALGTAAVAGMTVPLHPIAIAGYVSMIVNALAILPVGTTDGGRAALALFGRPGKLTIGSLVVFGMIVYGWFGSDILLFYSSFCIAFQRGNEIPARNEVDKLDLPRCFAAALLYVLAMLAIIPFK